MPDYRAEFYDFEDWVYLDAASQGPMPRASVKAVQEALELKKFPQRLTNDFYFDLPDEVRRLLAQLMGAKPEEIALTNGASDGTNAVSASLELARGDEVVIVEGDFPSNYYTWRNWEARGVRLRRARPQGQFLTAEDVLAELSGRTRLVTLSWVHYANGNRLDIARMGRECHRRGAALLVDASQAAGGIPFRVSELECDFLTGCGYKWLLSPYGTGFFWVREDWIERFPVREIYWQAIEGARNFNTLPREGWRLAPGARRWDSAETANFLNLTAMKTSLEFLLRVSVETIYRHSRSLLDYLLKHLPHDRCVLVSPKEAERRGSFLAVAARSPEKTKALWEKLREEKIYVSLRENGLRIGPHLYNVERDMDRLLAVLGD
jgi:selenocysteine lyase/cysteine desulfurase